jgi:DNA-binding response OmpR family regulator
MVPGPSKALDGISVLLVEDNDDYRLLSGLTLVLAGAKVDEAVHGDEGFEKALRGDHMLVLLDAHLPGSDGNAVARRLREAGYTKPVVALSASCTHGDRAKALKAGHNGYLVKPMPPGALVEAVVKYTRLSRQDQS